jgi:hypothetical protein
MPYLSYSQYFNFIFTFFEIRFVLFHRYFSHLFPRIGCALTVLFCFLLPNLLSDNQRSESATVSTASNSLRGAVLYSILCSSPILFAIHLSDFFTLFIISLFYYFIVFILVFLLISSSRIVHCDRYHRNLQYVMSSCHTDMDRIFVLVRLSMSFIYLFSYLLIHLFTFYLDIHIYIYLYFCLLFNFQVLRTRFVHL